MTEAVISADQPGRNCPLHYRYAPADFARAAELQAETLYVIGGLYGNQPALEAVVELAAREPRPVTLVFNGDFNWFNIDDAGFRTINSEVLRHHALRGNVETEIADTSAATAAGCGCGYPQWVGDGEVARSNEIIVRLRDTAQRHGELCEKLAVLPLHLVAKVADTRVAIVHGDLQSLAGWSLAQELLSDAENLNVVKKQIVTSKCQIVASSHTCLPVATTFTTPQGARAVFNNGAAGMPNFRGTHHGVITRIAATPYHDHTPLYGTRIGQAYCDAIALHYDHARWLQDFLALWPAGSPAHTSYHQRLTTGPHYTQAEAHRELVRVPALSRPMTAT